MNDDTDQPLSQIHDSSVQSLVKQIMEIQSYDVSREKSAKWADRLRFLDVSGAFDQDERRPRKRPRKSQNVQKLSDNHQILPLTRPWSVSRNAYIAISWRWEDKLAKWQDFSNIQYQVQRPNEPPHASRFPDPYYDRAIRFAQAHRIRLLWIDTECIQQDCPDDQSTGIQGMDMVYRNCRLALGILTVCVRSQRQIKSLSALLDGDLFDEDAAEPRFVKGVNPKPILDVLRLIMSDDRWDRTWIFQEDHCASSKMILLIPLSPSLFKNPETFGDLDGELQISCATFRKATTDFYLACNAANYKYDKDLASKLRQYNVINQVYENVPSKSLVSQVSEDVESDDDLPTLPPSSLSVLDDIKVRHNSVISDRLAIWANCCRYNARLDGFSLAQAKYGLSTSYLCLYLLNGEILNHSIDDEPSSSPSPRKLFDRSIYKFLNRSIVPLTFDPPCHDYRQSFIDKYCRLGGIKLTPEGSRTQGWLWTIGEAVRFSNRDEQQIARLSDEHDDGSSNLENSALLILLRRLMGMGCDALATTLGKYLAKDSRSNDAVTEGYHFFVDKMVRAVLDGMQKQRPLCLAYLFGETEARGLFVGTGHRDPAIVFTGFWKDEEKYASIEVQHQTCSDTAHDLLYPQAWINGLWFAPRGTSRQYIFPYPFSQPSHGRDDGDSATADIRV